MSTFSIATYDIEELKARIRAIARRPLKMEDNHEFAIGSTILDMSRYILRNGEKEISLSKREALLCLLLFRNIGQVLEREKILRKVWGMDNFVEESNVDTYIHFVRRRLKEVESPLVIKSIHGVGYCLVKP